jgi:hypothetical protein
MMNYAYDTSLQETMILTEAFHTDRVICDNGSLYKFIWVQEGKLTLIVDHVEIEMEQDEIISVSNLHRTEFKNVSGRYLALLFNENFYGIYKHEKEVSCSGVLFNGTSGIVHLRLPIADSELLHEVVDRMVTSSTPSVSNFKLSHGEELVIMYQRKGSEPYCSIAPNGSTALPRRFDILFPFLSRTKPLEITFL